MPISMRAGFEEYVAARSSVLLRFAYVLCGDRHLAEDLVQEVLVKAHRRWSAIEVENPDAYLKRALVRAHVSWRRRRASSEIVSAALPDRAQRGFDDAHASRDEVWTMLATLPAGQRAVLVLRYFEDLDDQRIAELVGVSASTVRSHAHRGLKALRESLTEHADEAPAGTELLATVRRGVARAAVRRRAAVSGGVAVLVAALLVLVSTLLPNRDDQPVEPTPSFTSGLELVPTALTAPEFPYALGYLPQDAGPGYVSSVEGDRVLYFGAERAQLANSLNIEMYAEQQPVPDFLDPHQESATTVNGSPARQWVTLPGDNPTIADNLLEWQQDGRWLYVRSGRFDIDELHRVADGMRAGRTTSTAAGPIDAVSRMSLPAGYGVASWDRDEVCAVPAAAAQSTFLCISLLTPDVVLPTNMNEFTLDGDRARAGGGPTGSSLFVERSDGRVVDLVQRTDGVPFTTGDLVAIYRSIVFEP